MGQNLHIIFFEYGKSKFEVEFLHSHTKCAKITFDILKKWQQSHCSILWHILILTFFYCCLYPNSCKLNLINFDIAVHIMSQNCPPSYEKQWISPFYFDERSKLVKIWNFQMILNKYSVICLSCFGKFLVFWGNYDCNFGRNGV